MLCPSAKHEKFSFNNYLTNDDRFDKSTSIYVLVIVRKYFAIKMKSYSFTEMFSKSFIFFASSSRRLSRAVFSLP